MLEPNELKKIKIESLINAFTEKGYKSDSRIGPNELFEFLSIRSSSGRFDPILGEKLFQVLGLDDSSTLSIEEFINGFLQFEEDLKRNAELFNLKLNKEQEIYANLAEQCRKYKSEQLNEEGLCENSKVYGEITDINIRKKLEGIKEIILKVIYNDKLEEMHFMIGDINSNEMLNKSFEFKPTSRKDHFEFIMKGVNDKNQIFDIGSKVFPLTDINSQEEYIVQIVVPEIDNEEQVAAHINAKIVLYWSDYKFYEKQKKKSEKRIRKLTLATNQAIEYLKLIREIYGDLTRKKPDIIVDFNNEKILQRKGGKLNVNFNNTKEMESGGNFIVEFNNEKEVRRSIEPIKVEFNNAKEVKVQNQTVVKKETKLETIKESLPYITKADAEPEKKVQPQPIINQQVVTTTETIQKKQYVNQVQPINYVQKIETEKTELQNEGQQIDINNLIQQNNLITTTVTENRNQEGMKMAETIGYGAFDASGNVEAYGTGGYEMIDNNDNAQFRNSEIIKETEIRTSVGKAMINQSTKETLFSHKVLPVKVLEAKINEPIYENVKTLPVIYGQKNVVFENKNNFTNYNINQSAPTFQEYTMSSYNNNNNQFSYSTQ